MWRAQRPLRNPSGPTAGLLDYVQRAIEEDCKNRGSAGEIPAPTSGAEQLTDREREVMELLAAGKSMKQIASQLSISIDAAVHHISRSRRE